MWIANQLFNYGAKVCGWIDLVTLARGDYRKENFRDATAVFTTQEEPRLATTSNSFHLLLSEIVMCALTRRTGYVGTKSHPATLAPAGSTRGGSGGDE